MQLRSTQKNKNRYTRLIFLIVIVTGIIGYFLMRFSSGMAEKARPVSEQFISLIATGQFQEAKELMIFDYDLSTYFTGDGEFSIFKETGFGADSKSEVRINYYLTGKPAQNRNISINRDSQQQPHFLL